MEKLALVGERIWNMEKQFNLAAGLHQEGRQPAAAPQTEPAKTGPGQGAGQRLDKMLPEYYKVRGWNEDGVPKRETRGAPRTLILRYVVVWQRAALRRGPFSMGAGTRGARRRRALRTIGAASRFDARLAPAGNR